MRASVEIPREGGSNLTGAAPWRWSAFAFRFAKFALVGGSGVPVNFGMLFMLHGLLQLPILLAASLAVETAIINNFLWNNFWTFGQRSVAGKRFIKFNLTCLGGLLVSVEAVYILVQAFGWHYLLANLIGIALASGWNFCISVAWTWKERTELPA